MIDTQLRDNITADLRIARIHLAQAEANAKALHHHIGDVGTAVVLTEIGAALDQLRIAEGAHLDDAAAARENGRELIF